MDAENIVNDHRKTILILGINSFVGSNLAEFLKKDFHVVGTYFRRHLPIPGILMLPCNVLSKEELQLVMYTFRPDFVVYCVGLTSLKMCSEMPNVCDALNSAGLYNVAEMAPRYGARVLFFSSQFVFAGENRNYNEMDNPDVTTQYGKAMASSEFYLQKSSLNYLIIRCCKLYGRGLNPLRSSFFELMQRNFKENISFAYDDFLTQGYLDIYYLCMVVKICIDKNISNRVIHFSSQDSLTTYEFAKLYCETFGDSESLINKGKWHLPALKGTAHGERTYFKLDVLNIEGVLKIKMPSILESLQFTYSRFHGEKMNAKKTKSKGEGISFI
jgi:dTDP-4-dehydrorhamnose reductase